MYPEIYDKGIHRKETWEELLMKISNEDVYDIIIVAGQSNADCYGIKKNESFFFF